MIKRRSSPPSLRLITNLKPVAEQPPSAEALAVLDRIIGFIHECLDAGIEPPYFEIEEILKRARRRSRGGDT